VLAKVRFAELERLVGRLRMDIDFFSTSLARTGAAGSARKTQARIAEVIKAMTAEAPIPMPTVNACATSRACRERSSAPHQIRQQDRRSQTV